MCEGNDKGMKTFRIMGAVFCVLGFFFALIGILSFVFPLINNEHVKMILNSFQEASTDTLTNTLNSIVLFCLHSAYFIMFFGISLMVAGGLVTSSAHKKQVGAADEQDNGQKDTAYVPDTPGVPSPAYYPGGIEPELPKQDADNGMRITLLAEEDPMAFAFASPNDPEHFPNADVSSFSSDDEDSKKLMHYDEQFRSFQKPEDEQSAPEPQTSPDYAEYVSNTPPTANEQPADQPAEEPRGSNPQPPVKPRIVSTMGKRRF